MKPSILILDSSDSAVRSLGPPYDGVYTLANVLDKNLVLVAFVDMAQRALQEKSEKGHYVALVTDPIMCCLQQQNNVLTQYFNFLNESKTKSLFPVVVWTTLSEKDVNSLGLEKGVHYDKYCSKYDGVLKFKETIDSLCQN